MDIDGPEIDGSTQQLTSIGQGNRSSDVLFVFVHGFWSSSAAWGEFPREIQKLWGVEAKCLVFDYLSKPWQGADIENAADALRDMLTKMGYQEYFHVVIFTHSTGALVVKKLLTRGNSTNTGASDGNQELVWRIRTVINLAGAHQGGRWFTVVLWPLYLLIFGLPAYGLGHVFGRIGYFKMGGQLMPIALNRWLKQLNSWFDSFIAQISDGGPPKPLIFNATAQLDRVVITDRAKTEISPSNDPYPEFSIGLALHFLKSILGRCGDCLHCLIAPQTPQWKEDGWKCILAWDLAIDTIKAVDWFNSEDRMTAADVFDDPDAPFDQRRVVKRLLEIARQGSNSFALVTGPSGAGKSITLRSVARALMVDWISKGTAQLAGAGHVPMPLTINLRRLQLSDEDLERFLQGENPELLWSAILRAWLPVAEDIRHSRIKTSSNTGACRPPITEEWIGSLIGSLPTVIVLDSMNEFGNNHLRLKDKHLADLVSYLLNAARQCQIRRSVICAMSSGRERIFNGGEYEMEHVRLGRLSDVKVESLLSKAAGKNSPQAALAAKFRLLPNSAKSAIALPSIITKLLRKEQFDPDAIDSNADLLELCLQQLLADRELGPNSQAKIWPEWANLSTSDRIDILTIMASAFATRATGVYNPIMRANLTTNLRKALATWTLLETQGAGDVIKQRMVDACNILLDEEGGVLNAALSSTIFQEYSGIVFDHNQWADLCLGRYLCLCLKAGNLALLRSRAFHPSIYAIAADYLVGRQDDGPPISFSREQIEALLAPIAFGGSGQFVVGNFAAVINRNAVQLDPAAIHLICAKLEQIPMLGRHVMLAALCHRAISSMPNDHSRDDIRRAVFPQLLERIAANMDNNFSPATSSLAWFYMQALAQEENVPRSQIGWVDPTEEVFLDSIDCAVFPTSNEAGDDVRHRSLLDGYLQSFEYLLDDPSRLITAIHYLLYAVIAKHKGRVGRFDDIRIKAFLDTDNDPGRRYLEIIMAKHALPELEVFFSRIKKLYNSGKSSELVRLSR